MPLSAFQKEVFGVLRDNRSPDSFVMGATVLNAGDQSSRFSHDIDLSHDIAAKVAESALQDTESLRDHGFEVEQMILQPSFQRARVSRKGGNVVLEWVYDSAFRFFPVEPDPQLGYRLHFLDAATNKILALAGRAEPRDFVDAIQLHRNDLSLGALAWAAAGKDEGLNPAMILDLAHRFAHYRQAEMDGLAMVRPLNISELKRQWTEALAKGNGLVRQLPAEEIGCLYLDEGGNAVEPDPASPMFSTLTRHYGSVRGAWPRIVEDRK